MCHDPLCTVQAAGVRTGGWPSCVCRRAALVKPQVVENSTSQNLEAKTHKSLTLPQATTHRKSRQKLQKPVENPIEQWKPVGHHCMLLTRTGSGHWVSGHRSVDGSVSCMILQTMKPNPPQTMKPKPKRARNSFRIFFKIEKKNRTKTNLI